MLGAVMFAHAASQKVCNAIISSPKRPPRIRGSSPPATPRPPPRKKLKKLVGKDIEAAYKLTDKSQRSAALNAVREKAKEAFVDADPQEQMAASKAVKILEADIVRNAILKDGRRIDGRDTKTVRPIEAMVGFLPRTHGSALFTRGETQAIGTTTLGTKDAEQMIDGLEGLSYSRFMVHYNFPPYSVGEVGRFGAPSRRDTGHGKLAWRALHPMLPSAEEFPYTIRVLSDITESNGSLVDGYRLRRLARDDGRRRSAEASGRRHRHGPDPRRQGLRGDQRHPRRRGPSRRHGLQGCRHREGITSLQMDIKVAGITEEIMKIALAQAKDGRAHILGEMAKALDHTREELSAHAPRIETMSIPKDKIREVIGTGGKVIREIVATTGAKVDIDDEGVIKISSSDLSQIEAARQWIRGIVAEPEPGTIYTGKVASIVDFGAFVTFMPGKDGLVHVSEIKNERVENVRDVLSEGQEVKVKLLEVDQRGKVRLSMRLVDQETGEELPDTRPPREPREGGDRGPRGDARRPSSWRRPWRP